MGYDPVERHLAMEKVVTRMADSQQLRRYYRFRADRWYGGIATADAAGCGLLCRFCWVSNKALYRPSQVGDFYLPVHVASRLHAIARHRHLGQMRISGGEPTIGRSHLIQLLDALKAMETHRFILETNGILIGEDPTYAHELCRYDFLHVRVSLKGCSEGEFTQLSGANPEGFQLQLTALANLMNAQVSSHPAAMASFSTEASLRDLRGRIKKIDSKLVDELEIEEVIVYPTVAERIARYGLKPRISHAPQRVPKELV